MPKLKSHKGLLKRVKVTANGKVKWKRAGNGHLASHKSGSKVRDLRQKRVAKGGDVVRLEKMLHCQLNPGGRD